MANKGQGKKGDIADGYLNAKGTFLRMDNVENSLGHKSVDLGGFIHKHRKG
jgi:hypothetical protein